MTNLWGLKFKTNNILRKSYVTSTKKKSTAFDIIVEIYVDDHTQRDSINNVFKWTCPFMASSTTMDIGLATGVTKRN